MKNCAICKELKPHSEFYRQAKSADGLGSYCKPCSRQKLRSWHRQNKGRPTSYVPDPEKRRKNAANSAARHPERARARAIVREMVDRGELPRAKECRCADCGRPANQYDHPYGYVAEFASIVEPVCFRCHGNRSIERNEHVRDLSEVESITLSDGTVMLRVGAARAGHYLDNMVYQEFPEVNHA